MAARGKEYELAIRISGTVDKNFNTSLVAAKGSMAKFKADVNAIDQDFAVLDKGFNRITGLGAKCFQAVAFGAEIGATAIAGAGAASVYAGKNFETAFAGVRKTVEATEEEYANLRQEVRDMAKEIPSSQVEIAGVMEVAGQLGIAKENLKDFTGVMIDLGVSTNLTAEDAATSLAKFANITNMDPADYERLGSTVVALGNNFATTEEDIVRMSTNLASAGDLVGLSEAQIMALSTSMSSVGIAAEKGGSTMSKLLKKMQMATELGGESLGKYAAVANMTGKQFKETFQKDAVVALSAFIDGLDDVERNGRSAVVILDEMGLDEIRLSNTILALAGAEGLMTDAIELSNQAWEENTALSIEAGKRYETTDSKIAILKNNIYDLGITAYDEMRAPFIDSIDMMIGKASAFSDYLAGENGIRKWMHDIELELPTLQRKIRQHGGAVLEFIDPLIGAGKWFLAHPKVITTALAGITATLAAYKTESTIVHAVNALMKLSSSPVTAGLVGATVAVGALAEGFVLYKQHETDIMNKNLEDHFGNLALSMEDLSRVAEYIVGSDSLGGVKEALDAFGELDGIAADMDFAVERLGKMNWKVSIGMELTEDEQASYQEDIRKYAEQAQEYALQAQYAVHLNMEIGGIDQDITGKVNQFYEDSRGELTELGTKLNEAVTDAFNDGLLDIQEVDAITRIQKQMAEIEQALATGDFDAQLSLLGMNYAGGGNLTADSFQNLQAELKKQVDEASQVYQEGYAKNYAAIEAAYRAGGYLTEGDYERAKQSAMDDYTSKVESLNLKSALFQTDTILQQYDTELAAITDEMAAGWQTAMEDVIATGQIGGNNALAWDPEVIRSNLGLDELSKGTRNALAELWTSLEPQFQSMQEAANRYLEAGKELPENLKKGLEDAATIGAIAGSRDAIWQKMALEAESNPEYKNALKAMEDAGIKLPEQVSNAIKEHADSVHEGVDAVYEEVLGYAALKFRNMPVNASIDLNAHVNYALRNPYQDIKMHADGGIFNVPHLGMVAESGPEAVVPLDRSQNAKSIWTRAGEVLGMFGMQGKTGYSTGDSGTGGIQINYAPQIHAAGGDANAIRQALEDDYERFVGFMRQYEKDLARLAF